MQELVKDEVVRLACAEGVITPYTAAVGVLLRNKPADASKAVEVVVPIQVSVSINPSTRSQDLLTVISERYITQYPSQSKGPSCVPASNTSGTRPKELVGLPLRY